MAPLGYAVGFVNGVERYLYAPEKGDVLFFGKGFRSHIKEFGDAPQKVFLHLGGLYAAEGGIKEMGNSFFGRFKAADGVHLIFHEGYERRYNYGRSFHEKGRELIAQRLAAAGGH